MPCLGPGPVNLINKTITFLNEHLIDYLTKPNRMLLLVVPFVVYLYLFMSDAHAMDPGNPADFIDEPHIVDQEALAKASAEIPQEYRHEAKRLLEERQLQDPLMTSQQVEEAYIELLGNQEQL